MIPQNKVIYQNIPIGNSKRTSIQNRPSIFQTTKSQRNSSRVKFKPNSPDYSVKIGQDKNNQKQQQQQKSQTISILDSPRSSVRQVNTNQVQLDTRLNRNRLVMTNFNKNKNTLNLNTQHTNTFNNVNNNFSQNHTDQQIAYAEKIINAGLSNSIPLFGKQIQTSEIIEQRKYKIFSQNKNIKFQIPPLEEYYSKQNYKGTMQLNGNMSINDQLSINKQLNGSNYSFLDFMNYDKVKNMNISSKDFGSNSVNMGLKNLKTMKSRNFQNGQYKDSIKQCSEEDRSMSRINSALVINQPSIKQITHGKQGLKIRGIYLLFGFLLAILILIIINHFV